MATARLMRTEERHQRLVGDEPEQVVDRPRVETGLIEALADGGLRASGVREFVCEGADPVEGRRCTALPGLDRLQGLQCCFFGQNVARFRLYRHRFLQVYLRLSAFFKIYQILKLKFLKLKILAKFCNFRDICNCFAEFSRKSLIFKLIFLRKF